MLKLFSVLLFGVALAAADESAPVSAPLRVMSFNVRYGTADDGDHHWEKRRDAVVEAVRAQAPDLLGTQETLSFQADHLAAGLPGYGVFGAGREDGRKKGEAMTVFFRKERFEMLDGGHFWLSESPDKPGVLGWDAVCARMATWLRLRDRAAGGRELLWVNTHLDHRGATARLEGARQIRRWIEKNAGDGAAVLVTGDFNCQENSAPYAELTGKDKEGVKLADSFRVVHPERGPEEASFHGFRGKTAGGRIDWILVSGRLVPKNAGIVREKHGGLFPSDHYPVTAVLEWAVDAD